MSFFRKCLVVAFIILFVFISGNIFIKTEEENISGYIASVKTAEEANTGPKCIISGKISLPEGLKATRDTAVQVYFFKKNKYPDIHSESYAASSTALIKAGSDSAVYFLGVDLDTEGYIGYSYYEADDFRFCYEGFYTSNGTSFNFSKAKQMKLQKTSYTNMDLQLIKGRKITGKVRIPRINNNAALDCSCLVIPVYDNGTPGNLSDDVDIPQEDGAFFREVKEASYSMIVPEVKASYRIRYEMGYNYPSYGGQPFSNGYYAKAGAAIDYGKADVITVKGSYNGPVNFTVLDAGKIQGKISLEGGKKARSEIRFELDNGEGSYGYNITILEGENSADYWLSFADLKSKHIITITTFSGEKYYFGQNKIVRDRAAARQFDLSKGDIEGLDVFLPDEIAEAIIG